MTRNTDHRYRFRRKPLLLLLLLTPIHSAADDAFRYFDLPGQTLQSGLVELALQADVTVVANHQLISGYQSSSIIGPYTPQQALTKLLSRAPLNYHYDETTKTFVIIPRHPMPAPERAADSQQPQNARVEEVVVYAPNFPFRYNTLANTQFGNGSAIYDNSRFHTVLPAQLIQDSMPLSVEDLLKNSSGISPADGRADTNDDFYMRGFPRHALYIDGFRVENTTGGRFLPDNMERVEILKGPSTIRYGQGEPGGMINLVRKKPTAEPLAQIQASTGTNGLRKLAADVSNSLTKTLSYRLNAVNFQQEYSADVTDIHQRLMAPSMRWSPDAATELNLSYEFQKSEQQTDDDFALLLPVPEENFPGATLNQIVRRANPGFQADRHLFQISGNHFFNEHNGNSCWQISGNLVWQEENRIGVRGSTDYRNSDLLFKPDELSNLYMALIPGGQVAIPVHYHVNPNNSFDPLIYIGEVRSIYDEESSETGLQSKLELDGTTNIAGFQNHLNMGVDWHRQDLFHSNTIESRRPFPTQSWPESESPSIPYFFNAIFAPDRPLGTLEVFEVRQISDEFGIYLQDTVEINEKLSATAGARVARIQVRRERPNDQMEQSFEPVEKIRVQSGMHYQLTNDIEFFVNYAQGLRSNQSKGVFGLTIDEPELSDQWEAGIKGYFFDGRAIAAIAAYRINKTNIYWVDSFTETSFTLDEYGQQVWGTDLDFTLEYSPATQLVGSFSAQDNELTYGPYTGNIPAATTPNTASIFLHHKFNDDLSAFMGGYYMGHRYADHANNYKLDAFFTLDAGAEFKAKLGGTPLALKIKIKNLTDEEYYSDVVVGIRLNEGEGRQVIAGVTLNLL
jgi:outer membrane receptor protein involved in Fe transport